MNLEDNDCMSDYVILTDSSCDLTADMVRELGIQVLPLSFHIGDESYHNYSDNRDMSPEEFYAQVRAGAMPTTSAVNPDQYTAALEPILSAGKDALILSFSSGLSATYQSSKIAADEMAEKYPDRKVFAVDTLCACMGQGLIVWMACRKQAAGETIEAVRDWVEANKLNVCHWVAVDDLSHLKRGGRISATTAFVGGMLSIKPIIHVDAEGKLVNVAKTRGRGASLDYLVEQAVKTAIHPEEQTMFINHSDCLADAKKVGDAVQEKLGVKRVVYNFIGPVIGAHTGTGTVAFSFLGSER